MILKNEYFPVWKLCAKKYMRVFQLWRRGKRRRIILSDGFPELSSFFLSFRRGGFFFLLYFFLLYTSSTWKMSSASECEGLAKLDEYLFHSMTHFSLVMNGKKVLIPTQFPKSHKGYYRVVCDEPILYP